MTRAFPRLRADAFLEQLQRPMGSTRPRYAAHKRAAGRSRDRRELMRSEEREQREHLGSGAAREGEKAQ